MHRLHTLLSIAEDIVRQSGEFTSDVEVRIVRRDQYGFEIRNRELAPQLSVGRVTVGIRAFGTAGLALTATSTLDVDDNVAALKAALSSGRPTPLDRFAGAGRPVGAADGGRQVNDAGHDPAWEPWFSDPALLRDLAVGLREGLYRPHGASPRLESLEASVGTGTEWTALATRNGSVAFKRTSGLAYAQVNAVHHALLQLQRAPDAEQVAQVAALGARAFEELPERVVTPADVGAGGDTAVVLHPSMVESILRDVGQDKLLGSSVRSGMTTLAPGDRVWDPKITLLDSGIEPGLASSRPVDDELIPTRATPLVRAGAVESLVWSRRSALEAGRSSTGNGYRTPMLVEDPSEAPVRDRLSGLVMEPGDTGLAALIGGADRGLYVLACLGLHGADRARAAFSTTVYDGFWVEGGRPVALLAPGAWNLSGHVFPGDEGPGIFSEVELSRERFDGASARLPWVRVRAVV